MTYIPLMRYKKLKDRARICKPLRIPGIDFKESIPPAYVTWRAGTSNRVVIPAHQRKRIDSRILNRFTNSGSVVTLSCNIRKCFPILQSVYPCS